MACQSRKSIILKGSSCIYDCCRNLIFNFGQYTDIFVHAVTRQMGLQITVDSNSVNIYLVIWCLLGAWVKGSIQKLGGGVNGSIQKLRDSKGDIYMFLKV